jgi:hypothetical protein
MGGAEETLVNGGFTFSRLTQSQDPEDEKAVLALFERSGDRLKMRCLLASLREEYTEVAPDVPTGFGEGGLEDDSIMEEGKEEGGGAIVLSGSDSDGEVDEGSDVPQELSETEDEDEASESEDDMPAPSKSVRVERKKKISSSSRSPKQGQFEHLIKGAKFTKLKPNKKSKERLVWVSVDMTRVLFGDYVLRKVRSYITTSEIKEINAGCPGASKITNCFTIVTHDPARCVFLEADSFETCELWMKSFINLVQFLKPTSA